MIRFVWFLPLRLKESVPCPWRVMWASTASQISSSTSPFVRASASIFSASVHCHTSHRWHIIKFSTVSFLGRKPTSDVHSAILDLSHVSSVTVTFLSSLSPGETGIGKSTLMDTLFNTNFENFESSHFEPQVKLRAQTYDLQESNVRLRLTVVNTVGFGDQMNKQERWEESVLLTVFEIVWVRTSFPKGNNKVFNIIIC